MSAARILAAALVALLSVAPAQAARPIVDLHKLDAYFALFAADSNAPWKATTVRLDTYSSAPVEFSVYRVNPADVLSVGSNGRSRALDTRRLHPILHFSFTPPGGYQFQPNTVDVPLGSAQGFFIVEARRGNVGEQVWINRTRVGLIATQTPAELYLRGVDLGTGTSLVGMRVQLLVGDRFVTRYTDAQGAVRVRGDDRPDFVLAQWGDSYAFLSLLPQAPVPSTVVGVRTASAVVHAGGTVRVVGFVRMRRGNALEPASGDATISLRQGATLLAQQRVRVDRAGAFSADLVVPANASAGDDAILAEAADGVGGASVHVDADAGDLTLDVASLCGDTCDPDDDVPVLVKASRGDVPVHVSVIRSPHVYVGYYPDSTPWGTTVWLDERVTTDADGRAEIRIPRPTDGLASTYGVRVDSAGATADTRIVVPTAPVALRLHVDADQQQLGSPIGFDVYASDVQSGRAASGVVTVQLSHGGSVQQQTLTLDALGHARGAFTNADLGTNLVVASLDDGSERAMDATQLEVVAAAAQDVLQANSADVSVRLDRDSYRPGEPVIVDATAPGASGEALVTLEGASGVQADVVRVVGGRARATLRAIDAPGALDVAASFVRDGAIESNSVPLDVDGAGRPAEATLSIGPSPQPGADTTVALHGADIGAGMMAVRLSAGDPSGSAVFSPAAQLLAFGLTTTQTSAPQEMTTHPWVDSTGEHPLVLEFVRHTEPPPDLTIAQSDTTPMSWSVSPSDSGTMPLHLPERPGRYTLSVLDIADDGRVIVATTIVDLP